MVRQLLYHVQKITSSSSASVKIITNATLSLDASKGYINDSLIKSNLDKWYNSNLSKFNNVISDSVFCTDRDISSGLGYGASPTIYASYRRINNFSPSLICPLNDSFGVLTGNQKLSYSVGLITADEVNMAGGVYEIPNELYYLYTGFSYWTMSPGFLMSFGYAVSFNSLVKGTGAISGGAVNADNGVRPVINIKGDVSFTGTGTSLDPYVINF